MLIWPLKEKTIIAYKIREPSDYEEDRLCSIYPQMRSVPADHRTYKGNVIHGGECKGDNLRYTNLPIMEKG